MYWIKEIQSAIGFIEDRLTENLHMEVIAKSANSFNTNFQRIFNIITGITVGDYIRFRRLTLAGKEINESDNKIIDIALRLRMCLIRTTTYKCKQQTERRA